MSKTEAILNSAGPAPETLPVGELKPWDKNPRDNLEAAKKLASYIERDGWGAPLLVQAGTNRIIAGHTRLKAAKMLGLKRVPVRVVDCDDRQATRLALADNRLGEQARWDDKLLAELLSDVGLADAELMGWTPEDLDALGVELYPEDGDRDPEPAPTLAERFGVPPFSILDGRQGYWTTRKRRWLDIGIRSELGRGLESTVISAHSRYLVLNSDLDGGGSVFDPVVCELSYRWYCARGGTVLDPFAGGSVRGVVAGVLGLDYWGSELRGDQVEANRANLEDIAKRVEVARTPTWVQGDSREVVPEAAPEADLVFSCPPYADLEVYSKDPADISNMSYEDFLSAYRDIIASSCAKLRDDRFAVFVVGEVRDKKGAYRGLVADTIRAFEDAGLVFYNDAVLVVPTGTIQMKTAGHFTATRKLTKIHQNVLVFLKGDAKRATAYCDSGGGDWLQFDETAGSEEAES